MLGLPQAAVVKKAAKKGTEKYKNLNKTEKQAVNIGAIVGVIGVFYAGYKVISGINGVFSFITGKGAKEERKEKELSVKQTYTDQLNSGVEKPTFSKEKASVLASRLLTAFLNHGGIEVDRVFDSGTDEDMVWEALSHLKNRSDWALVSLTYGAPRGRSLANELGYELNNKEMQKARSILSKIGVTI